MNQQGDPLISNDDVSLGDYVVVLLRKWWVVASVFIIAVVASILFVQRMPDIYSARTKLLIVTPVSERLITDRSISEDRLPINPFLGTNLSVDTLSALGTANDLLQTIISELDLKNPSTGNPWAVERLASMISVKVETAGAGQDETSLPLLTMVVQGENPQTLKSIAETWSDAFVAQNSELFATEAARSFDFVTSQYNDTVDSLWAVEQEKLSYQKDYSLPTLESQLKVVSTQYEAFLGQLLQKRSDIIEAQARLGSAEEALVNEPQFVTLKRTISSEAILVILANSADTIDLNRLPDLVANNEERNDLYFDLKASIVNSRSNVAILTSDISYLETQTKELESEIDDLSIRIATANLTLARLDREINILTTNFNRLGQSLQETQIAKEEQAGFIQVVESAVAPSVPIGPERRQFVIIAAGFGLIFGVVLAFLIQYLQGAETTARRERPVLQPNPED